MAPRSCASAVAAAAAAGIVSVRSLTESSLILLPKKIPPKTSAAKAEPTSTKLTSRATALFDQREQLEHRQVHGDHDRPDHDPDADHQDRLDDRGQRLDACVDLVLVEVGDLAQHLVELA